MGDFFMGFLLMTVIVHILACLLFMGFSLMTVMIVHASRLFTTMLELFFCHIQDVKLNKRQ